MTHSLSFFGAGFKILRFGELQGWRVLEVDSEVPLDVQEKCPADGVKLETIATLVAEGGAARIRVGHCSSCGYIGYIDRPTKEWINKFYSSIWDKADSRDIESDILKQRQKSFIPASPDASQGGLPKYAKSGRRAAEFLDKFGIDKSRPVCEIGSGFGESLKQIYDLGFKNVIGVENSSHRARIGREAYGFKILEGAFEEGALQQKLRSQAPYGLIYSHHVLEHTYNPAEIIRLASELQKSGDLLIISLPNAEGEPSLTKLLYFPHLHSFTKDSLEKLLNLNSYEVVENFTTPSEVYLVGRKIDPVRSPMLERIGSPDIASGLASNGIGDEILKRFVIGLDLSENSIGRKKVIFWYKVNTDKAKQLNYYGILRFLYRNIEKRPLRSLVAEPLKHRYTDFASSPIEIQFKGNIKLTYK